MSDEGLDEPGKRFAAAVTREFPPLLNIEHQELIRAMERAQVSIAAHRELFESRLTDLSTKLDDRYAMQTKALDAAFTAQTTAMSAAFAASEKAVQAALDAAEKAVDKANTASEKRFESVNEFRAQLSDIMATLISRTEAEARFKAIEDKVGDIKTTIDKGFSGVSAAQDTSRWIKGSSQASYAGYYALGGVGLTVIIIVIAIMNLITSKG